MANEPLVLFAIFVPVVGSFLLPVIGRISEQFRNLLALGFVTVSLVCCFALVSPAVAGRLVTFTWPFPLGLNMAFTADALAVFMAIVSSLVGTIIVFYSFSYISHYENRNEYYFLVVLFLGSMMGLVFSSNLICLYVFWEITAIASWRLIGFFRDRAHVIRADKAFLVTAFGAVLMLLGFVSIYQQTGSFDLAVIKEAVKTHPLSNLTIGLILVGILSKSATLPFHAWLPDAGVAPSPVTALLHAAVLVKIGVYFYARMFIATAPVTEFWHTAVPVIAAVSALVSAGAALVETDLKRIIAYSTVSQIGFIFLGLSIGNAIGVMGGLLYILMHGIAKGGLFLTAGIVEQNMHTKDITKLGGLMRTMPLTALSFLFCAASVMGIPPFGGFFSKFLVIQGAVNAQQLAIALTFLVGAFLTLLYLLRVFTMVFLGDSHTAPAQEGAPGMVFCVALLGFLSIVSGILINIPSGLVRAATEQMLGGGR